MLSPLRVQQNDFPSAFTWHSCFKINTYIACIAKQKYTRLNFLLSRSYSCYWEWNECFAYVWSQIKTNMSNFHPLEVVGRGSETQIQVGENLNK